MFDMEKITHKEKVTKKRGSSAKLEEMRLARIQEYQARLIPLFSNIEDVEQTCSEEYILVKHDGIFDMVALQGEKAECLDKDCLDALPELKSWWNRFFD